MSLFSAPVTHHSTAVLRNQTDESKRMLVPHKEIGPVDADGICGVESELVDIFSILRRSDRKDGYLK